MTYLTYSAVQISSHSTFYNQTGNRNDIGILSLPNDVLRLIAKEILSKEEAEIPLGFVCRKLRAIIPPISERTTINVAIKNAIRTGSLSLLKWYYNKWPFPLTLKLCKRAAANGHLPILQWLRKGDENHTKPWPICPWDVRICQVAAMRGHLAILQWAQQNGCPWDKRTCEAAAKAGHLAVLQWARQNGCPWDESTCHEAASQGHLLVLQWARNNGCPWNEWTCYGLLKEVS